jgi:hypothetical protein
MTSAHRLIAILAVWGASAIFAAVFAGVSISRFLPVGAIVGTYLACALVALIATVAIAFARPPAKG